MSDEHVQANPHEAFEAELRSMLEAREREKDSERQQTSRRFTIILCAFVLAIAGAVMLFQSTSQEAAAPPVVAKPMVAASATLPNPLNPDPNNSDPGLAHDLKPFSINKDRLGGQSEDIRFAMQLMNFMDAPQLKKMLPIKEENEPAQKP
jgi:hypothetical protein